MRPEPGGSGKPVAVERNGLSIIASMRPEPGGSGKRGSLPPPAPRGSRFNEAGARRLRKTKYHLFRVSSDRIASMRPEPGGSGKQRNQLNPGKDGKCFNEAGARRLRKTDFCDLSVVKAPGFNEAGARRLRKTCPVKNPASLDAELQ